MIAGFGALDAAWTMGSGQFGWALYGLVRLMAPDTVVEIGTSLGKTTAVIGLALESQGRGKVVTIDPFIPSGDCPEGAEESARRLMEELGLTHRVEIWKSTSDEAAKVWSAPIDLLYIDGLHDSGQPQRDWETWSPFVRPGGMVCWHDVSSGCPEVADQVAKIFPPWIVIGGPHENGWAICWHQPESPFRWPPTGSRLGW